MDARIRERLAGVVDAYDQTLQQLSDPTVLADHARYTETARRHSELKEVVDLYHAYQSADAECREAEEMAGGDEDREMVEYLWGVVAAKRAEATRLEKALRSLLLPSDPRDSRDVIMEIRAAAGGEEAGLWAADLFRMYNRYAERHGWKVERLEASEGEAGGLKEVVFSVKGRGAFSRLKFEAGPHRVQRVPKTESQGRIHTSIATVAVLPEAEDVEVDVKDGDLQIDVFRSSGPGGQSVNTTDSAVRITHLPTGLVVTCQEERSQLQNKEKAMRILRARLYDRQLAEHLGEIAESRKAQVGSGERAEKIRTYNFRENRVSDHRVNLTIKRLPEILEGDLDELIDALSLDEEARRLSEAG